MNDETRLRAVKSVESEDSQPRERGYAPPVRERHQAGQCSRGWLRTALCLLAIVVAGCNIGESATPVPGSPTTTLTPSGDVLRIEGQPVRSVYIPDPAQDPLYAMTNERLYVRRGGVWEPTRTTTDLRALLIDPADTDRLFRGGHPTCGLTDTESTEPLQLEVSHDGGNTWRPLGQGKNVEPIAFDLADPEVLYGSDCDLAISTTSGNTWTHIDPLPDYNLQELEVIQDRLLLLGTNLAGGSQLITVNVADPKEPQIGDVLLDLPGSASFDANDERIVVGAADTIHLSSDGGLTWASSKVGLETVTAASASPEAERPGAAIDVDDVGILTVRIGRKEGRLYAGTPHGLYLSQDNGTTWVRYDAISPNARVTEIQYGLNGEDLYVTTDAGVVVIPSP